MTTVIRADRIDNQLVGSLKVDNLRPSSEAISTRSSSPVTTSPVRIAVIFPKHAVASSGKYHKTGTVTTLGGTRPQQSPRKETYFTVLSQARTTWAGSSVWQSDGLLIRRSRVQIAPGPCSKPLSDAKR